MKNLIIPVAVLSAVGMMIFPLPGFLLDILLAANIGFSLALLVNSLYVKDVNTFSSLPTLLLLATLFRLSLNISTTRQLLSHGSAPEIVVAFGNFVVGGNLAVGIVIFLILSIVQFMVIAKGAERVAEVSARFTLDAMPGKQMAIDADMRAGFLSANDAKEKRLELQRESKLYGALDGAMKFVKGDAIAGLLIIAVNIVAGILIGVSYHDLSFSEAVSRFTLFTVGDGLVSQIPAILVCVAAGVVVTQVSDKDGSFIGSSILSQLGREPQAVMIVAILLFLFSITPGLPAVPFVVGGSIMCIVAIARAQQVKHLAKQAQDKNFSPKRYSGFVLQMGPAAMRILASEATIAAQAVGLRNKFFERWGIVLPEINFDLLSEEQSENVKLFFENRCVAVIEKPELVGSFAGKIIEAVKLFSDASKQDFIDDTQVRKLLEVHSADAEDLINDLLPEVVSVTELTGILKELVADGIAVVEFRTILQAIAEHQLGQRQGATALRQFCHCAVDAHISRLSYLRIKLRQAISKVVIDERESVTAWTLGTDTDAMIAAAVDTAEIDLDQLKAKLKSALLEMQERSEHLPNILISSYKTRSFLQRLIAELSFDLRVVAAEELVDGLAIEFSGQLAMVEENAFEQHFNAAPLTTTIM